MSYGLKGGLYMGCIYGTTIGIIKGDTRSLDYASHALAARCCVMVASRHNNPKKLLSSV